MKNYAKTFVLLIAIAAAITAGIYLAKVISDDVPKADMDNIFDPYCEQMLAEYAGADAGGQVFASYNRVRSLDSIMYAESVIDSRRHSDNISSIVKTFAPRYLQWCRQALDKDVWSQTDLIRIGGYAWQLKKTKDGYGALVLSGQDLADTDHMLDILDRYDKAWEAASRLGYFSPKTDIDACYKTLNGYLNDSELKDQNLKNKLRETKQKLCDNHYKYVDLLCDNFLKTNFVVKYGKKGIADFDAETEELYGIVEDYINKNYSAFGGVQKKDIKPRYKEVREYVRDQKTSINNTIDNNIN